MSCGICQTVVEIGMHCPHCHQPAHVSCLNDLYIFQQKTKPLQGPQAKIPCIYCRKEFALSCRFIPVCGPFREDTFVYSISERATSELVFLWLLLVAILVLLAARMQCGPSVMFVSGTALSSRWVRLLPRHVTRTFRDEIESIYSLVVLGFMVESIVNG